MITNTTDIPLALAVWLLHDDYDYSSRANYISATQLMRPVRQIILSRRLQLSDQQPDVEQFIARALGHAIHDGIEKAWLNGAGRSLRLLGYPDEVVSRVVTNPSDELLQTMENTGIDPIPVYLEQRATREIDGHLIGGKFDIVAEGIVQDFKSTSAYTWLFGTKDEDYQLQASIYRWIDAGQEGRRKITEDYMQVNFVFTDWSKMQARSNPKYPQSRVASKRIELLTEKQTEIWLRSKLNQVGKNAQLEEHLLPECTDEELWRSDPAFKYYADPGKTNGRSTRNFKTVMEANAFMHEKGKGVVITVPGEPRRCGYCEAFPICTQRLRYFP